MTTFWIRLSRVTKPGRSTSHLRPNNNHVSGGIPLRPSRENSKQYSLPAKSWQLCFGIERGILLVDFMAHGTTINADRYCETLKKLRRAIQNRRRGMLTKGVCLLHNNARPHVARQTVALLDQFGWDIITHPPYSPDLAPCDYHLFPKLKEHLSGRRFSDDDKVKVAVQRFVNDMAAS